MTESERYRQRLKDCGLYEGHEEAIEAVCKMMENPLTLEQKRAQIAKGNPHGVRYSNPRGKIIICTG